MKELVEVLAKALVDHPDEVIVTETEKETQQSWNFVCHQQTWGK